ncbi:M20/M25/M40 family metallo-hydrolase [Zavarzinia sp. CC-PAN008]|uniref:M20/M25/M40 family metallo-hydrolase n=1 Tax=Zavarzinia sp. CC-PAN008 TaxID=3243332 RepID=UPI003F742653
MQPTAPTDIPLDPLLDDLAQLVAIDSGSYDAAGVDAAGDWIAARAAPLGLAARRWTLPGFGARLCLMRPGRGRGTLVILGHLDTVWPVGTVAAWPFAVQDGWASGPGVGDMKGGLVMALHALARSDLDAFAEVRLILVPDEEIGSIGSRAWIEAQVADADWVLVMEPARANGSVIRARGAVGALVIRATGLSAHAAIDPAAGASAVKALARLVEPLEALSRPQDGVFVTVGILRGGDARQVVPAEAEMHVDLRAPAQAQADALLAAVDALLVPVDPRVGIVRGGGLTRPAFPSSASAGLYDLAAAIAAELGLPYAGVATSGGSDGSFAAALGRPTLDGLGPVCVEPCSRRERVPVASLAQRTAVLASLIQRLPNTLSGAARWA